MFLDVLRGEEIWQKEGVAAVLTWPLTLKFRVKRKTTGSFVVFLKSLKHI
jgi:hypothetical protein